VYTKSLDKLASAVPRSRGVKAMSPRNLSGRRLQAAENDSHPVMRGRQVERRDPVSRERLVKRVLSEFREMPCLRLTPAQAQRLFGLRADVSTRIINSLIRDGHLRLDPDGRYAATEIS
jgi:hypothetical protein